MVRYMCLKNITLIYFVIVIASCATTNLPAITEEGAAYHLEKDERQIWLDAEQLERQIDESGLLYKNDELISYINSVVEKLISDYLQTARQKPRVKIVKHPFLNAFALPHGVIYLHTGIVARMENEAQLSTVLGHELVHFTHRHTVKQLRSVKNKAAYLNVLQAILYVTATALGGGQTGASILELSDQVGALWVLASVSGYSRELETEADEEGLRLVIEAGYDPNETIKVFKILQIEIDEQKVKEPFFFGTHPLLQERIDNYRRFIATKYAIQAKKAEGICNSDVFLSQINQLLLDNALLDLQIGRVNTARSAIAKHLQKNPQSAQAHFLMGEIHRRMGTNESNIRQAIEAYQKAAQLNPNHPEPYRELGLLYLELKNPAQAALEFELYLSLNPKAVDARIIKGYLTELKRKGMLSDH